MSAGEGFLRQIVAATRAAVRAPDYFDGLPRAPRRPPASWREAVRAGGRPGTVIAEFKRRSPGAADPRLPTRTPSEFAARLEAAPVGAYSCLAAIPEFGGHPRDVADLAAATGRPVLFKDFVVDLRQIEAAYRAGAAAVLLIARLAALDGEGPSLGELAHAARARGLEVVLEWHAPEEISGSGAVPADVFGVNVRDLDSLRLRPDVARATIRAAVDRRPLVGMSGVDSPETARAFWALGVDAILVGSAIARAPDPAAFVRALAPPPDGGPR